MARDDLVCPFTNKLCNECVLYRGRHHYISSYQQARGCIRKSKEDANSAARHDSVDFQAVMKLLEPWVGAGLQSQAKPRIRLKLIDMESGVARVCQLEEAKAWDWDNPEVLRMIDGFQISSWDKLVEILSFKAEKGYQEVKLYEAPRFMMLAGG